MVKSCSIDGCDRPLNALGFCSTHYAQKRRAGLVPISTRARGTLKERFFRFINKTESCWIWTGGSKTKKGYGQMDLGGKNGRYKLAHRVSYEIHNGEIPAGMVVMHTCDNPSCVNPLHLVVGTQSENILDSFRKGRKSSIPPHIQGEKHGASKLNEDDVAKIRISSESVKTLAEFYQVNKSTIEKVIKRKTWRHLA